MFDNMSFGEKLLGLAALGTVGVMTGGAGDAAILGGAGDAAGADLAASGTAGGMANMGGSALATGDAATTIPSGVASMGTQGAGVTNAAAAAADTGAGAGVSSTASNPSYWEQFKNSNFVNNMTTPAAGATGTWGTGAGYGPAGQAAMIGGGIAGINYLNRRPPVPGVPADTGPLSKLYGAQGVQYPNNYGGYPTQHAAGGGLMQLTANPNPPMAYNMTPTYNSATSTPVPQSVLHYASGGATLSDVTAPAPSSGAYDQYSAYLQAAQAAQDQQVAQQQAQQAAQQQSMMPGPSIAAASGGMMNFAQGGISDLGHYSDGGQLLKGPGDGMSDSIPATIANKQPARLANDEFVVPADVVSHLGNGSSDSGAKKLYDMMDRVRRARTGSPKQAKAIHPDRYMPG